MIIKEKEVILKNGQQIILRSPRKEDAKALIEHLKKTSKESYFLLRYPEEINLTTEEEESFIESSNQDGKSFMMLAIHCGKVIGMTAARKHSDLKKHRHRGDFSIAIVQDFCNCGLGTVMMNEVIANAKSVGFEQLELGVYSDNSRAQHLYEKTGFTKTGVIPNAYKLNDGTYRDEIQMILKLK